MLGEQETGKEAYTYRFPIGRIELHANNGKLVSLEKIFASLPSECAGPLDAARESELNFNSFEEKPRYTF